MENNDAKWINDNINDPIADEEGDFEAEVFLSTDGKHTVNVRASTKAGRKAALAWSKAVYDKLIYTYGTKQAQAKRDYETPSTPDLGKCKDCGAPNKMSTKGKPYCSAKCWL